jgi:hypothetical protein
MDREEATIEALPTYFGAKIRDSIADAGAPKKGYVAKGRDPGGPRFGYAAAGRDFIEPRGRRRFSALIIDAGRGGKSLRPR